MEPKRNWKEDVCDYFLFGLKGLPDTVPALSNDARSLKENIWSHTVGFEGSPGRIRVEAQADAAARLKGAKDGRSKVIVLTA